MRVKSKAKGTSSVFEESAFVNGEAVLGDMLVFDEESMIPSQRRTRLIEEMKAI